MHSVSLPTHGPLVFVQLRSWGQKVLSKSHVLSGFIGSLLSAGPILLTAANVADGGNRTTDVGRINIREPDGRLRMVLSSAALEPGIIVKGHEQPHPNRRSAGILFFNDEATENGGLIFDGHADENGTRNSNGSLTFDRYEQDQAIQVSANEDGSDRVAGLSINDQPEQTFDFPAIERARKLPIIEREDALRKAHVDAHRRVFLGRQRDGSSELVLKDARGADRLILRVTADGTPSISFLDASGRVTRNLAGAALS